MKVQEIYHDKPAKRVCEFRSGEVFRYDGDWFMAINVNFDYIQGWTEFVEAHLHNPLECEWNECELTSCVCLENGNFCFLSDYWYVEDYGEAEMRVQLQR